MLLKVGSKGDDVRRVQQRLKDLGYIINVDGIYGSQTKEVVVQFQKNNGLVSDGIVGKKTMAKLFNNVEYPVLRYDSRSDYVKILQSKLNAHGYNLIEDGIFGNGTKNAVLDFQRKNNLVADGIVGKNTWSVLSQESDYVEYNGYYVYKINPLKLKNEIVKMAGNQIKGDFVNGTFFGWLNGTLVSVGVLVNDSKILAKRLSHDNVKRGHFIVYKDGTVAVKMIKDIDLEENLNDIKFAISGFNMFPLNLTGEWFDPKTVGYRTWRTMLGYDSKSKKAVIVVARNATAEEGQKILKNLGINIAIGLDSGGSTCARFNGKIVKTTNRVLHNIIRW